MRLDAEIEELEPGTIIGWEAVLTVAGPGFQDTIEIRADDREDLNPVYADINGLTYERYRGESDDEYVEVRFDYIIERAITAIRQPEPETPHPSVFDRPHDTDLPGEEPRRA